MSFLANYGTALNRSLAPPQTEVNFQNATLPAEIQKNYGMTAESKLILPNFRSRKIRAHRLSEEVHYHSPPATFRRTINNLLTDVDARPSTHLHLVRPPRRRRPRPSPATRSGPPRLRCLARPTPSQSR